MLRNTEAPVESVAEPSVSANNHNILLCFSHLRWNFVFQRPQHLLSRFARQMPVIFWEEPVDIAARETPYLQVREAAETPGVRIAVPHLPEGMPPDAREATLRRLLDAHLASVKRDIIAWYYTPMMLDFSRHLEPVVTVYDAMDELSKFRFAPPELIEREQELIDRADILFTGGASLFEAKRGRHSNVHCFPSSVDRAHFARARAGGAEPDDQAGIARPRLGFFGVIDERFDIDLLDAVAAMKPEWSFVMVGPVVKISDEELPRRDNIHYLGPKSYDELPAYLSRWDVALMPFALNESTEFISPTKTPEYLAGGKPVVSTPVRDVVRHYGAFEGVKIAAGPESFAAACEEALELSRDPDGDWLAQADVALSASSWDITQARMAGLIEELIGRKTEADVPELLVAAE